MNSFLQPLLLLVFTLVLSISQSLAQHVGINTNSPAAPLHVSSSGQVQAPGGLMLLGNPSEVHMELDFNRIQSFFGNNDTPVSLLLQQDGGRVGINTYAPAATLHVSSAGQVQTPGGLMVLGHPSEVHMELDFNRIQSFFGNNDTPVSLLLQQDGGNVGIHTQAPAAPLHVSSPGQISTPGGLMLLGNPSAYHMEMDYNSIQSFFGNNNSPTPLNMQLAGGNVGIGLATLSFGPKLQVAHDWWQLFLQNSGDGSINDWFFGSSQNNWSVGDNKFVFSPTELSTDANLIMDSGGDVLLVPQEHGKVGIGVTSIGFLPDGYLLAVDGKAIFEEVRVELSGAWPDYVFADDYALTPLASLKQEIDQYGHLPGIPSAETVESQGFDLGDMQRRLLEKVEELTLYMIQADKEISQLKDHVKRLEATSTHQH